LLLGQGGLPTSESPPGLQQTSSGQHSAVVRPG